MVSIKNASLGLGLEMQGLGLGLDKKVLFTRLVTKYFIGVSTDLTEQISRRFQEGFQEKSRIVSIFVWLQPAMQCTEYTTFSGACDDELQPTLIATFLILHCSTYNA